MLRATLRIPRPEVTPGLIADTITLDHRERHRRRVLLTCDSGLEFLLDLPHAAVLEEGDALKLKDGRLVLVRAAPERLIEVRAESPLRLMTIAWHIGNRHIPCEITAEALYIAEDHVLMDMVRGLGASAEVVERPFRPERGAYGQGGGHQHRDHRHGHDHRGDHDRQHGAHDRTAHGSHHADGAGHGHSHEHDHGDQEHDHHHGQRHGH